MAFTDQEIVNAIREGTGKPDPYLAYMYRENRAPVMSYVLKNQGHREDALEVLHLGIIKAFEAIQDGQYQGAGSLNRFVLTICRNTWINRAKRQRKTIHLTEHEDAGLPDESRDAFQHLASEDNRKLCHQLLGTLGEPCKKILLWAEGEDRPMKWIAQNLGYANPQVAMNKKSNCKKKLISMVRSSPRYTALVNEIVLN